MKILREKKFGGLAVALAFVLVLTSSCGPREEEPAAFDVAFGGGWYSMESDAEDSWRWAKSPAVIRISANTEAKEALFEAEIRGAEEQKVVVLFNGSQLRELNLSESEYQDLKLGLTLREGENVLEFVSDQRGRFFAGDDRELGFILRNSACRVRLPEDVFDVAYADGWYGQEVSSKGKWQWTSGSASLQAVNILGKATKARLICHVRTVAAREIVVSLNGEKAGTIQMPAGGKMSSEFELTLPSGASRIEFSSAEAASKVEGDSRELSFCLYEPSIVAVDL